MEAGRDASPSADPWTGVEPGLAHPGWSAIVHRLTRWKARSPAFLENGIKARDEILAQPDLPDDRREWYAFERELYVQVLHGSPATLEVCCHA